MQSANGANRSQSPQAPNGPMAAMQGMNPTMMAQMQQMQQMQAMQAMEQAALSGNAVLNPDNNGNNPVGHGGSPNVYKQQQFEQQKCELQQ